MSLLYAASALNRARYHSIVKASHLSLNYFKKDLKNYFMLLLGVANIVVALRRSQSRSLLRMVLRDGMLLFFRMYMYLLA